MDPAAWLIHSAPLIPSWLSRRDGPARIIAVLCWLASVRNISLTTRLANNSLCWPDISCEGPVPTHSVATEASCTGKKRHFSVDALRVDLLMSWDVSTFGR